MKGIVYILIFAVASAAQAQRLLPDQQREQQREQRKHLSPKTEMALRKLTLAEMALTSIYIDTLDENKLTDAAIKGMLSELDPHTTYTTAEETKKLKHKQEELAQYKMEFKGKDLEDMTTQFAMNLATQSSLISGGKFDMKG